MLAMGIREARTVKRISMTLSILLSSFLQIPDSGSCCPGLFLSEWRRVEIRDERV